MANKLKFHVAYFDNGKECCKGINLHAETMEEALTNFRAQFPNKEISYIQQK